MKTLLTSNWTNSNTDTITPVIDLIVNHKIIDMGNSDYVLIYDMDEQISPFGIGANEWAHEDIVSIDIRTTYKRATMTDIRAHLIKMKDEVFRILKANIENPDTDFQLAILKHKKDLSDKSVGIGRMVIDVSMKKWC